MKRVIQVDFSKTGKALYYMKKERQAERKENQINSKNVVHMVLKYGNLKVR